MTTSRSSIGSTIEAMLAGSLGEPEMIDLFGKWSTVPLTAGALADAAQAMRKAMLQVDLGADAMDTCGTGGSGKRRINTSTLVAFIVAAAGGKVAKHGNRAAGGRCGSFDLLEALGAKIELTPDQEKAIFGELGIAFLFARLHHPAMRHVASARKTFGKPTIFNLLGPLSNPAGVKRQLLGTPFKANAKILAAALQILGTEESWIVTGDDGLDEVTLGGSTTIFGSDGDERRFSPADIRLPFADEREITGGTTEDNLRIFRDLAAGTGTEAHRNLVIVNAAHALVLAKVALTVQAGAVIASDLLRSGKVGDLIHRYVEASNDLSSVSSVSSK
ncbi:MAG: anthranilate phosphoribosyltransferase [Candidatus Peribacteraceae bacterium]|nr:anthranilate phosphoribosyltransferase [Candidatus Peribacteraceae bacterium]